VRTFLDWKDGYFVFEDGSLPIAKCTLIGKSVDRDASGKLYDQNPAALVAIKPTFDLPEVNADGIIWPKIHVDHLSIEPTLYAPWWWPFRILNYFADTPMAATASAIMGEDKTTPLLGNIRVIGLGMYCKTNSQAEKENAMYEKYLRKYSKG
jgi:hypothetical protein